MREQVLNYSHDRGMAGHPRSGCPSALAASLSFVVPAILALVPGAYDPSVVWVAVVILAVPTIVSVIALVLLGRIAWIRIGFNTASILSTYSVCVVPAAFATLLLFPAMDAVECIVPLEGQGHAHAAGGVAGIAWVMLQAVMCLPLVSWLFRLSWPRAVVIGGVLSLIYGAVVVPVCMLTSRG